MSEDLWLVVQRLRTPRKIYYCSYVESKSALYTCHIYGCSGHWKDDSYHDCGNYRPKATLEWTIRLRTQSLCSSIRPIRGVRLKCRKHVNWAVIGQCYGLIGQCYGRVFRGGRIMVWAGISLGYHTNLYSAEPSVRLHAAAIGPAFVFMDDNACPHRAALVDDLRRARGLCFRSSCTTRPILNPI